MISANLQHPLPEDISKAQTFIVEAVNALSVLK